MRFVPLGGLVLASLISCAAASAQTLYRCGNEYRDTPCPGGKAVDTQDPRTPEQRAQTLQASAKEAALAEKMENTRLAAEATAAKRLQAQAQLAAAQAAKEEAAAKAAQQAADKAQAPHAHKAQNAKNHKSASSDILTVRLPKPPKPPKNAASAVAP
jgi:type IV secretory pathway VirB10-like protein